MPPASDEQQIRELIDIATDLDPDRLAQLIDEAQQLLDSTP